MGCSKGYTVYSIWVYGILLCFVFQPCTLGELLSELPDP